MDPVPSERAPLTNAVAAGAARRIERIAREALPTLADFCLVHLAAGRGIECVAGVHSTREGRRDVRALMRTPPIRRGDRHSTVAAVVRTNRPMLRASIRPDVESPYRRGSRADLIRRLAPTAALVVPIRRDGLAFGALSLCYAHSGRSYVPRHVRAAERLAARIAEAVLAAQPTHALLRLRPATRHAGQGAASRQRLAPRD